MYIKQEHLFKIHALKSRYRGRLILCNLITVLFVFSVIVSGLVFFYMMDSHNWIGVAVCVILFLAPILLFTKIRNLYHSRKRAISLLNEFITVYTSTLNAKKPDDAKLEELRRLEAVFISHNDDLTLKKTIWGIIEGYVSSADNYLRSSGYNPDALALRSDWEKNIIDTYKADLYHNTAGRIANDTQYLWLKHDALKVTNLADRFTYPIYSLKRELRKLNFWFRDEANNVITGNKRTLLRCAQTVRENELLFERFIYIQKVYKKLKLFLREFRWLSGVGAMMVGDKMRLKGDVYRIVSAGDVNPRQDWELTSLLIEKEAQITSYENDFWRIHKKSLRFYFYEAAWLLWAIPLGALSINVFSQGAYLMSALVFIGGALWIAFGEMMMVHRQRIKIKSKISMPTLITRLMGIKHMYQGKDHGNLDEFKSHFKYAEKHFIAISNEMEAVVNTLDSVKNRVKTVREKEVQRFYNIKREQMNKYYGVFKQLRFRCLRYGMIETFAAIVAIPSILAVFVLDIYLGGTGLFMHLAIILGFLITEGVTIFRHIMATRYKYLFLLMYQELTVVMLDEDVITDSDYLVAKFKQIEDDAIQAASEDRLKGVPGYIQRVRSETSSLF